jgi:hypothetical protein
MSEQKIPGWIRLIVALVLAAQAGILLLVLAGALPGPARNLLPQALFGGAMIFAALAAWLLRFHEDALPPAPARAGIIFLAIFALFLVGVYFKNMRALLAMPYDLASWSEPMLVVDIIKLHTGTPLYLPPGDSNSNTYTFLAPVVTYWLARIAGHPASIPVYRLIQQLFLALAALLAASSAVGLLRVVKAEEALRLRRWWFPFFFFASFLFATNDQTSVFNIYLHNDPIALLASTLAFWLLVKHAVSRDDRWLWPMAVMPAFGFLAKQYLALWAAVYAVYLWLDGKYAVRSVVKFAAACFASVALAILGCVAVWGKPFVYWVFQVMGGHTVAFVDIVGRFGDAGWYIVLGLVAGLTLLHGENFQRLAGIMAGWLILLFGGLYTSGITFHPSHLGPLAMVSCCFVLAALAKLWPAGDAGGQNSRTQQWARLVLGCVTVVAVFAALRFPEGRSRPASPDLARYAHAIEHEFEGLPPDRVLLDVGEWVYLRADIVMKDQQSILVTHRVHSRINDTLQRAESRYYARILVHLLKDGHFSYEIGHPRGVEDALLRNYREVRRIPHAEGMENWLYHDMMMGDIVVLEPIPQDSAGNAGNSTPHP